jgi:hypothetical protein
MKASELRIGNLVDLGNRIAKVTEINHLACVVVDLEETQDTIEDYERVKGIILTEEWLLKLGFIYHESIKHWVKNWGINGVEFIKFDEYYNLFSFQLGKDNYKVIDIGVHQLQNLWFVLTGEEII